MRYFSLVFNFTLLALSLFNLSSCSFTSLKKGHPERETETLRNLAHELNCHDITKKYFLNQNYEEDLNNILIQKKLITFTEKKALIHYPKLDWIIRVRKSFNNTLRNWNNFQHPAFYLFNKEDIIPMAKKYSANLDKILTKNITSEEDVNKSALIVSDWIKSFQNYQTDLDELIEERISLQYNISLLKKFKLKTNDPLDIQITIKRGGEFKNEIITLRKEDKNLKSTINALKSEMKELDGSLFKNGKIKDRIIRQAMLSDMLNILYREMEYVIKNTTPSNEMLQELEKLSLLLKNSQFTPSTYGLFKIENKKFTNELMKASKIQQLYSIIKNPYIKILSILSDYFKNKKNGSDIEKIGILKKAYNKITSITPKQASIGGGLVVSAGIGFERYFAFSEKPDSEIIETNDGDEISPSESDQAHKQQLKQTEIVETLRDEEQKNVIEEFITELIN
jgi:hypothetical protein